MYIRAKFNSCWRMSGEIMYNLAHTCSIHTDVMYICFYNTSILASFSITKRWHISFFVLLLSRCSFNQVEIRAMSSFIISFICSLSLSKQRMMIDVDPKHPVELMQQQDQTSSSAFFSHFQSCIYDYQKKLISASRVRRKSELFLYLHG